MNTNFANNIIEIIETFEEGTPFLTEELVEKLVERYKIDVLRASHLVNTNLSRLKGTIIEHYKRGIYYRPKMTRFGKAHLNPDKVAVKLFVQKDDVIFGYETGASLLYKIGLTTQLPKYRFIATNRAENRRGNIRYEDLNVIIRKPNIKVTNDNYLYLQVIDALENKDKVKIDAKNPYRIINNFIEINNLDYGKLIGLANRCNKRKVIFQLAKVAGETRV